MSGLFAGMSSDVPKDRVTHIEMGLAWKIRERDSPQVGDRAV